MSRNDEVGELEISATGALLKQIALKMDSIHSSREINDRLATELKQIGAKVDDHDRSLMMIAKVMEDMNSNFHEFTDTVKEMQKDSSESQKTNQQIMMELKQVIVTMSRYEPRFEKIENRQIDGCPSSMSARKEIFGEMKHQELQVESLKKGNDKNREEINELMSSLKVLVEQVKVSNKRTSDLEIADEKFVAWKDGIYTTLVTYAVSIIGALILAIWGIISK